MAIERRAKLRYPLELNVRYHTMGALRPTAGVGQTINMSSGGMFLVCGTKFAEGTRLKLFVEWPSLLNGTTPLQLITVGTVLRSTEIGVSILFESYQFRTMSRARIAPSISQIPQPVAPTYGNSEHERMALTAKSSSS